MHLVAIGGSDAGISAALRARELGPQADVTVVVAAIFHAMTVDAVSDLDLSCTPPLASPRDATQAAAQAWTRALTPGLIGVRGR